MKEHDLRVFTEAAFEYFSGLSREGAEVGIPFVQHEDFEVLEYTGIIGISGVSRGCVYITASGETLGEAAQRYLGGDQVASTPDELADMIGEIANTISGNARRVFGESFNISVPICVHGRPGHIRTLCRLPAYVIPIRWLDRRSYLVVCLD